MPVTGTMCKVLAVTNPVAIKDNVAWTTTEVDSKGFEYAVFYVMLGATDPSHIIRTIEYWDIERRRYPGYDHVAVLIAEDVTARFLNVMSLLSGSIPLIAIQLDALEVGGNILLNFVQVLDQGHLLFPDVAGNKLFQSYQNIDTNPHVGLVFFIPGINETVRVNGTASIVSQDDLAQRKVEVSLHDPDDRSKHLQGIIIEVDEAYGHCPRALKFSHLWDTGQITENQTTSPIPDRSTDV